MVSKRAKSMEIVSNCLPTKIEPEVTKFRPEIFFHNSIYFENFG